MRPAWVIAIFAAGVGVGFLLARVVAEPAPVASVASVAANPMQAAVEPAPEMPAAPPPVPAKPVRPVASPALPPGIPPDPPVVPDAEYTGYSQAVDSGPVFRKFIDQKHPDGSPNRLGDLHRTLERELRDDSWAYPMEADLQNSLVAEVSSGKLTVEHLECRATICELRLSGIPANEQTLTDWTSAVGRQPWASRLYMNLSSTVSDGERVDSMLIFRRPTK